MGNLTFGQITSVVVGDGVADDTSAIQASNLMLVPSGCGYATYVHIDPFYHEELKAKLASAEYELEQSRKLALMAKVERDTAVSERNMALQALVKMVETRLLASRKAAAEAEAETPGAQMLRAIAVAQKIDRVR